MARMIESSAKSMSYKALLGVSLTAAVLTLGACSKKEEAPVETETTVTTPAETDTAMATDGAPDMAGDDMGANDEVGMASADGMAMNEPMANDGMNDEAMASGDTTMANDDVGVATADNAEIMDGTDKNEHISTN